MNFKNITLFATAVQKLALQFVQKSKKANNVEMSILWNSCKRKTCHKNWSQNTLFIELKLKDNRLDRRKYMAGFPPR
jgi:hypothetical protein